MLKNKHKMFWRFFSVLFIFFVTSTAFAQQPGLSLSESQFMQIIERIDRVEKDLKDYVDTRIEKFETKFETKFDGLDKRLNTLEKDTAFLNLKVNILIGGITLVLLPVFAPIIYQTFRDIRDRKNLHELIAREVAAEVAAQQGK